MLYKNKEGLKLSNLKVKYTQNGKEKEQFVGEEGKQWWIDFADKWENTNIIEFVDITYTVEQLSRFEEIKDFKYLTEDVENYVDDGAFIDVVNEELKQLKSKNDNDNLQDIIAGLIGGVL